MRNSFSLPSAQQVLVGALELMVVLSLIAFAGAVGNGASASLPLALGGLSLSFVLMNLLVREAFTSITELRVQQTQLLVRSLRAQKMELVGNITCGVAHDFNNILTVIRSVSDALAFSPDAFEFKALLVELDDSVARASLMTRQLLTLGNDQAAKLVELDLGTQVRGLAIMIPRLLGPQVRVTVRASSCATVLATRAGLEQVLLNLALNAREAMPQGGTLDLEVSCEDTVVCLRVKDSGAGMDLATQQKIFEPFFTTKQAGTGLGLATVQQKVAEFGGTITVKSALGEGTTFELKFARVIAAAPPGRADLTLVEVA